MRSVFRKQVDAVAFHAKIGAEITAAVHDVPGVVVQVRRTRMLELVVAVTGPRQPEIIAVDVVAGFLVDHIFGATQGLHVEGIHVAHMRFQALRRLAGVADGPGSAIDLPKNIFDVWFFTLQCDVLRAVCLAE